MVPQHGRRGEAVASVACCQEQPDPPGRALQTTLCAPRSLVAISTRFGPPTSALLGWRRPGRAGPDVLDCGDLCSSAHDPPEVLGREELWDGHSSDDGA